MSERATGQPTAAAEIEQWVVEYVAGVLGMDPRDIDRDATFDQLGFDSAAAVALTGELAEWLGRDVDPTAPYDYSTIRKLANSLGAADLGTHETRGR